MNNDLNCFVESLYADVRQYWEEKHHFLPRTGHLKFGIFYSPVTFRPPLMIIGANPGFDSDDDTKAPPLENLFFDPRGRKNEEWRIAGKLRELFGVGHQEQVLCNSVVINLLFFKSRCLDKHPTTLQGWRDNGNAKLRREIQRYCRTRVEEACRLVWKFQLSG